MKQATFIALLFFCGVVHAQSADITAYKDPVKADSIDKVQTTTETATIKPGSIKPLDKPVNLNSIRGYVMTHEHPTVGMAFGGNYAFAGGPLNYSNGVMESGYTMACGGCPANGNCNHGEFKGVLLESINQIKNLTTSSPVKLHDMGAHPSQDGPTQNSFSHLRYSTEWIRDAFRPAQTRFSDARMRIMVAYAMDNEAMCDQLSLPNLGNGGHGEPGFPCARGDSFLSLQRQLLALRAWADANPDIEIAFNAKDARRIANQDKLVVVLGVEADYAFGAEHTTFDPVDRLNMYYELGARTFYFAHKVNSRLSGADVFRAKQSTQGRIIRMTQAVMGCLYVDNNVAPFPLSLAGHNFCANEGQCGVDAFRGPASLITLDGLIPSNVPRPPFLNSLDSLSPDQCNSRFGEISEANQVLYSLLAPEQMNGFRVYPSPPGFSDPGGTTMVSGIERNNLGLSSDGFRVAREAMHKGMLMTIDHVSSEARIDLARLAAKTFGGYPLNAFHNNPNEMMSGSSPHASIHPSEYDFDKSERDIIRTSGGFFGARLAPMTADPYPASGISDGCANTSTENGKVLASLLDEGLSVGYSLDLATMTNGTFSRSSECLSKVNNDDFIHTYGPNQVGGLQHIGMMKKWHRELEAVGLRDHYLDKLKNDGAEQFLQMWERSEARAAATPR